MRHPSACRPNVERPLHLEARSYRDFTTERAYDASFRILLEDIHGRNSAILPSAYCDTPVKYITAPPPVAHYIHRPAEVRALRDAIFYSDEHRPVALTAVEGMGGIGKTVLARALFDDEVVQQAFPDGLIWITIGREPSFDWTTKLREIAGLLGHRADVPPEALYRTAIAEKAALIVIDDIWNKAHLDVFLAESPRSRFLFTTRDSAIARFAGAHEYRADLLDVLQARALLAAWSGLDVVELPSAAEDILRECGRLPLAVSAVGAMLRGASPQEWTDTAELLRKADLTAIDQQLPVGQDSFFRAIEVSLKALDIEAQERYGQLAVLLDDMPAPLCILETLWNIRPAEARRTSRLLADRSLAQRNPGDGALQLHDLQLDYVRAQYADPESLDLIHDATRLSLHVIQKDTRQYASQLLGRLLAYEGDTLEEFITRISAGAPRPWMRLLHPMLDPPGRQLVRTLEGHTEAVSSVAVTSDHLALTASHDKTLKIWDLNTGRLIRTLQGHADRVNAVAVTPDGLRAVSASDDTTVMVWDLITGRVVRTLTGHASRVTDVVLTPDGGQALSCSSDGTLRLWDLETGCSIRTLMSHSRGVTAVALARDGKRAISGSGDGTLDIWDLPTGRALRTFKGHKVNVTSVAVMPDGDAAVSASWDGTIKLWSLAAGRLLRTLETKASFPNDVVITADGQRAISAYHLESTLKILDLATGRVLRTLEGHSSAVTSVAIAADGKQLISASWDRTVKVWELAARDTVGRLLRHWFSVDSIAVTPNGQQVVSASFDEKLVVWDVTTGLPVRVLEGHSGPVTAVALTPDGLRAVSASDDTTVKVWDLVTGRVLHTFRAHRLYVYCIAVTPDGRYAVSGSYDRTLKILDLDLRKRRAARTLEGHSSIVNAVALTPDGRRAVSASDDKTLILWDLATARPLRTLEAHSARVTSVALTPDGSRAVSASDDKMLILWDLVSGCPVRILETHADRVTGIAVTPDGRRAVFASWDNTIKVFDLQSGEPVVSFHCEAVARCCALVDNQTIVAGDAGGRIYFLHIEE